GSLFTICLPRLCPAIAGSPCYCCPVPLRCSAQLRESLCYSRLPRQWQAASALVGTSVGADCVHSGGCPSPTGLH
ncbi:hypothetical protein P7K49_040628, partial [Saguinus oedipus]